MKWYRLSAAQLLGTASMNLGYCHLSGHGVPVDKTEALRLFRLAVEQGEEKARPEVERLEQDVKRNRIRSIDATGAGTHFGIVGTGRVAPVSPWEGERSGSGDETQCLVAPRERRYREVPAGPQRSMTAEPEEQIRRKLPEGSGARRES